MSHANRSCFGTRSPCIRTTLLNHWICRTHQHTHTHARTHTQHAHIHNMHTYTHVSGLPREGVALGAQTPPEIIRHTLYVHLTLINTHFDSATFSPVYRNSGRPIGKLLCEAIYWNVIECDIFKNCIVPKLGKKIIHEADSPS